MRKSKENTRFLKVFSLCFWFELFIAIAHAAAIWIVPGVFRFAKFHGVPVVLVSFASGAALYHRLRGSFRLDMF